MRIQQINRNDPEQVFVQGHNVSGVTKSAGHMMSWHVRTTASADGRSLAQPQTSNLPAFAGVLAADTEHDAYGEIQTYGFVAGAFVSTSTNENLAYGQVIGPVTGQDYANAAGQSNNLGPLIVLSEGLNANQNTLWPVFVRALGG